MYRPEHIAPIIKDVSYLLAAGKPRMTVLFTDFYGTLRKEHITVLSIEKAPYAQYNDNIKLIFKRKGGRVSYCENFHGCATFAIWQGWQTQEKDPEEWQEVNGCKVRIERPFERNTREREIDRFPEKFKIGEISERLVHEERLKKSKVFQVVDEHGTSYYNTANELAEHYAVTGLHSSTVTRAELENTPFIPDLYGPMYNGEDEQGRAVIRYESRKIYDMLSR